MIIRQGERAACLEPLLYRLNDLSSQGLQRLANLYIFNLVDSGELFPTSDNHLEV